MKVVNEIINLKEFIEKEKNELLYLYLNKNYDELSSKLESQRKLRREFTKIIKDNQSPIVYIAQYIQVYNLINKIFQEDIKKQKFNNKAKCVFNQYKSAKLVVEYIYKYPFVNLKKILNTIEIDPEKVIEILKQLVDIDFVNAITCNDQIYYTITADGIDYLEETRLNN